MFRAQQNAFDDVVAKATDENLTSVNWEFMLDVCDRANESPTAPKDVIQTIIKRLAHRNANVQLYTLELANSLAQNCGAEVHRELSSRAFTEALLRLANDRNTHHQVKATIVERMEDWTKMFAGNHDLGIMSDAYAKLKQSNPNLQPPSKPHKQQITDADRKKEEDELQMALQLSIKENSVPTPTPASSNAPAGPSASTTTQQPQQQQQSQPISSSGTTAATVSRVRALFDFQPSEPGELPFKKGDVIAVIESVYRDWWRGSLRGQTGIFPLNYVEKLADPTPDELQREAQMEAEVFGEIKNVEKLLALLSTSSDGGNVQDNEEITTLYHSTLAIRPKLIELIGKYSQRKDDFTQLNEKFIKAKKDYETLLDQSMQPQPGYGRPGQASYGQPSYGQQQAPYGQYPPAGQHSQPSFYPPGQPGASQTPQPQQQPPRNGPSPFYVAGHAPLPGQLQTAYGQSKPANVTQQAQRPPQAQLPPQNPGASDPYNRRPESTYDNPQEIGTSGYQQSPTVGHSGGSYPGSQGPPAQARFQSYGQPGAQGPPHQGQPPNQGSYPGSQPPQTQGSYPGAQPPPQGEVPPGYSGSYRSESPVSAVAPLNPLHGVHAPPDHPQQAAYQQPQFTSPPPSNAPPPPNFAPPGKPQSPPNTSYPPYQGPPASQPSAPAAGGVYPGQAQYQPYHPPAGQTPGASGGAGGGGNDPSSFYR